MTQRGTQATVLGVMIGEYSPDSQHRSPIVILQMLAVPFSGIGTTS